MKKFTVFQCLALAVALVWAGCAYSKPPQAPRPPQAPSLDEADDCCASNRPRQAPSVTCDCATSGFCDCGAGCACAACKSASHFTYTDRTRDQYLSARKVSYPVGPDIWGYTPPYQPDVYHPYSVRGSFQGGYGSAGTAVGGFAGFAAPSAGAMRCGPGG